MPRRRSSSYIHNFAKPPRNFSQNFQPRRLFLINKKKKKAGEEKNVNSPAWHLKFTKLYKLFFFFYFEKKCQFF